MLISIKTNKIGEEKPKDFIGDAVSIHFSARIFIWELLMHVFYPVTIFYYPVAHSYLTRKFDLPVRFRKRTPYYSSYYYFFSSFSLTSMGYFSRSPFGATRWWEISAAKYFFLQYFSWFKRRWYHLSMLLWVLLSTGNDNFLVRRN